MAIPKPVRELVAKRSGGVCEGCGQARATDMHHRRFKSRGGKDTPSNLLHLCGGMYGLPGGNHSGCHGIAHSGRQGALRGWAVPSGWMEPAEFPYQGPDGSWWLLDRTGGRAPAGPPEI